MKKTLIVTGAIVIGLATVLGGWHMIWPSGPSYAAGALYRQAHFGNDYGNFRHHGMFREHRSVTRLCSDKRERSIEAVTGFVEGFVNLTPVQMDPWKKLTEAVAEGSAMIGKSCEEVTLEAEAQATPQKLAQIETLLETGLSVVQRVRPAFGEFYEALSAEQKQALESLMSRRHKSNWHKMRHH